jgi:Putative restriction endonuclease
MRRFTVDEYHRMIEAGILTEDDPVELLGGWIVLKMPHNPPHDNALELADEAIRARLPTGWRLRIQSAIITTDSEPEPDLAVVRGTARVRQGRHPGPADIGLLLEVADSTLLSDGQDKGPLYAAAGIGCYWILNLVDRQVEVYTDPTGPDANPVYRRRQDYRPGDAVPLVLDGQQVVQIPVADLLP